MSLYCVYFPSASLHFWAGDMPVAGCVLRAVLESRRMSRLVCAGRPEARADIERLVDRLHVTAPVLTVEGDEPVGPADLLRLTLPESTMPVLRILGVFPFLRAATLDRLAAAVPLRGLTWRPAWDPAADGSPHRLSSLLPVMLTPDARSGTAQVATSQRVDDRCETLDCRDAADRELIAAAVTCGIR